MPVSHQLGNINDKIEFIKRINGNCGVEKYNNWNENSLEGLNSRFELAEEIISEREDRSIYIIQTKAQREKRNEGNRAPEKCRTPLSVPT